MIISEQWLREWVDPQLSVDDLAHQITMAGLEVDAVESAAGDFSGVVVGEIIEAVQHPDADKLRVCQVAAGDETLQIVCGAPNAAVGLKAPLAKVGAVLPENFKIKRAKLRGVESHGMLCGPDELGLGDFCDGLMALPGDAPVGADLREYLQLNDYCIDVDLTPNRADCLSVAGIAREVGLLNRLPVSAPVIAPVAATIDDTRQVVLADAERCPRYLGRVIKGIDRNAPTPLWMREKLRRAGLRSIDAVVDVTNYVLLELGQPMHAFDHDKLNGDITVRVCKAGESLTLLDGQSVDCKEGTLLITDESGPLALAGIMGGAASAVSESTQHIFLECAFFSPQHMAGKARAYGLHTDSSHRYERGVDSELQHKAIERATALLLDIVGGEAGPVSESVVPASLPSPEPVTLRADRIQRVLGFSMDNAEVERILAGLGFAVTVNDTGWSCEVPSWRFDIEQEADLLEELARVYGYNNLPVSNIRADLVIPKRTEAHLSLRRIRRHLAARDYHEAITYSFVASQQQAAFDPQTAPVELTNPLSADLSVMRTSLLPGLVAALAHNTRRQQHRVRLFETGQRFVRESGSLQQTPMLALAITGDQHEVSWASAGQGVDFYDLKGDIESLLGMSGQAHRFGFEKASREGLHPGRCAAITVDGHIVGYMGALHPDVLSVNDISADVYVAEITLSVLQAAVLPEFTPLSKFPEVKRDLAVVIDRDVPASTLERLAGDAAGQYLTSLRLFDVYEGKGVDPKRKSMAISLTFRDQKRTLSDEDVNAAVDAVIKALQDQLNAELR